MADSVSVQMTKLMDEYDKEVKKAANTAIQKVSDQAVKKLKNDSPKKSGKYARGWTTKKERGVTGTVDTVVVHNKTAHQLTHLLENGHVIRNKKGVYGRTKAYKHIEPVADWANEELPAEIERELSR